MYVIKLSIDIGSRVARVWRALCEPAEVVQWDGGVTAALDAPADYPKPGQHVRWRLRTGLFGVLHDRPMEVVPEQTLQSMLRLGPYEMDERYRLSKIPEGTRIELSVLLRARVPLVGGLFERLHGGPQTRDGFEASLSALKRYCESTEEHG